jgi:hypothetical protein
VRSLLEFWEVQLTLVLTLTQSNNVKR